MLNLKVLVVELLAIDRLAACTVAHGEVTTLHHEPVSSLITGVTSSIMPGRSTL